MTQLSCPHCGAKNRIDLERLGDKPQCGSCKAPILGGVHELDGETFPALTGQDEMPVLVDFWASWCGPCRSFAPTFERAAGQYGGRLLFAKLDTEAHSDIAGRYDIRSIPTLMIFQGGQELGRISGALPAAQLEELIQQILRQTGL